MAEKIMVSPDEVKQTAQQMSNDVVRYHQSYEDVYKASDIMKGEWEGRDVTLYHQKLANYRPVLKKMEDVINEYIAYLNRAENAYRTQLIGNVGEAGKLPG